MDFVGPIISSFQEFFIKENVFLHSAVCRVPDVKCPWITTHLLVLSMGMAVQISPHPSTRSYPCLSSEFENESRSQDVSMFPKFGCSKFNPHRCYRLQFILTDVATLMLESTSLLARSKFYQVRTHLYFVET